jgi:hypothetical protein
VAISHRNWLLSTLLHTPLPASNDLKIRLWTWFIFNPRFTQRQNGASFRPSMIAVLYDGRTARWVDCVGFDQLACTFVFPSSHLGAQRLGCGSWILSVAAGGCRCCIRHRMDKQPPRSVARSNYDFSPFPSGPASIFASASLGVGAMMAAAFPLSRTRTATIRLMLKIRIAACCAKVRPK